MTQTMVRRRPARMAISLPTMLDGTPTRPITVATAVGASQSGAPPSCAATQVR